MKKSRSLIKVFFLIGLVIDIVAMSAGSTYAYLRTSTEDTPLYNQFKSAKINVQIVENGNVLSDSFKNEADGNDFRVDYEARFVGNTGTVDADIRIQNLYRDDYPTTDTFVRCRVVPIIRDKEGNNILINASVELKGKDTGWKTYTVDGETYYYWDSILKTDGKSEVTQDNTTRSLFTQAVVKTEEPVSEGCVLDLQILVDAVQARTFMEFSPVKEEWGLTNDGGVLRE